MTNIDKPNIPPYSMANNIFNIIPHPQPKTIFSVEALLREFSSRPYHVSLEMSHNDMEKMIKRLDQSLNTKSK